MDFLQFRLQSNSALLLRVDGKGVHEPSLCENSASGNIEVDKTAFFDTLFIEYQQERMLLQIPDSGEMS